MKALSTQGKRLWRWALPLMMVVAFGALSSADVQACTNTTLIWETIDPDTRGITGAAMDLPCYSEWERQAALDTLPPATNGTIQLSTSCSPNDCQWQTVPFYEAHAGWKVAFLKDNVAYRTIYFRIYAPHEGLNHSHEQRLRVVVDTDFLDPGRSDYRSEEWLRLKQALGLGNPPRP